VVKELMTMMSQILNIKKSQHLEARRKKKKKREVIALKITKKTK
jgi:hypothetical protein